MTAKLHVEMSCDDCGEIQTWVPLLIGAVGSRRVTIPKSMAEHTCGKPPLRHFWLRCGCGGMYAVRGEPLMLLCHYHNRESRVVRSEATASLSTGSRKQ